MGSDKVQAPFAKGGDALALILHSAVLRAAAHCWRRCPGADPAVEQAEAENPLFPSSRFASAGSEAQHVCRRPRHRSQGKAELGSGL